MSREPATPATQQSEHPEHPEHPEQAEQVPPRAADDDSVADGVWITRWKNEGGAYLPTD